METSGVQPISHHAFENYPDGTRPHTTSPLDFLIFALRGLLGFVDDPLSMAGAFISPLVGMGAVVFLAFWSARLALPFRWPLLVLFAFSPILTQAFLLGRPDHQSLAVVLIVVALGSEAALWMGRAGAWRYVAAVAWALALWVSLFEPLVLLALVGLARGVRWWLVTRRKSELSVDKHAWGPLGVFVGLLVIVLLWDGWRAAAFDPAFARWAGTIGELKSASVWTLLGWGGWLALFAPALLLYSWTRHKHPLALFWCFLLVVLVALTVVHARWGYFFVAVLCLSLPWALAGFQSKALAVVVFVLSLWPVAAEWDARLYPSPEVYRARAEQLADAVALRDAARVLKEREHGGVLAPWWFSPAVVWWSGQPTVGGTSHQSLPGILDSARFYLTTDPAVASEILGRRKVRYVLAYEPDRILSNSAQILGETVPDDALGLQLYRYPASAPAGLVLVYSNRFFRVFERPSADLDQ